HPGQADIHNDLGAALALKGRTADAIREFETALRLQPDFPRAHANLGFLLLQAGRARDAATHFEALLKLPDQASSLAATLAQDRRLADTLIATLPLADAQTLRSELQRFETNRAARDHGAVNTTSK